MITIRKTIQYFTIFKGYLASGNTPTEGIINNTILKTDITKSNGLCSCLENKVTSKLKIHRINDLFSLIEDIKTGSNPSCETLMLKRRIPQSSFFDNETEEDEEDTSSEEMANLQVKDDSKPDVDVEDISSKLKTSMKEILLNSRFTKFFRSSLPRKRILREKIVFRNEKAKINVNEYIDILNYWIAQLKYEYGLSKEDKIYHKMWKIVKSLFITKEEEGESDNQLPWYFYLCVLQLPIDNGNIKKHIAQNLQKISVESSVTQKKTDDAINYFNNTLGKDRVFIKTVEHLNSIFTDSYYNNLIMTRAEESLLECKIEPFGLRLGLFNSAGAISAFSEMLSKLYALGEINDGIYKEYTERIVSCLDQVQNRIFNAIINKKDEKIPRLSKCKDTLEYSLVSGGGRLMLYSGTEIYKKNKCIITDSGFKTDMNRIADEWCKKVAPDDVVDTKYTIINTTSGLIRLVDVMLALLNIIGMRKRINVNYFYTIDTIFNELIFNSFDSERVGLFINLVEDLLTSRKRIRDRTNKNRARRRNEMLIVSD